MPRRLHGTLACVLLGAMAHAQTLPSTPATAPVGSGSPAGPISFDAQAGALLKALATRLGATRSFQVDAALTVEMPGAGGGSPIQTDYQWCVQRPNRMALRPVHDREKNTSVICDGRWLYVCVPGLRRYTRSPAPPHLDAALEGTLTAAVATIGRPFIWLVATAHSRFDEFVLQDAQQVSYAGRDSVEGLACHRLTVVQSNLNWQLWLSADQQPVPVRIAVELPVLSAAATTRSATSSEPLTEKGGTDATPQVSAADQQMRLTLRLSGWQWDGPIPPETFTFQPPAGVQEVPHLLDPLPGPTADALMGRPAPAFRADLLGGGVFDLRDNLGRQPLVLSFWVSWRRTSAGTLAALAAMQAQSENVRWKYYGVNIEEPPAVVRSFLQRHSLSCPVILDAQGTIAALYGVGRTPWTVLIDSQGRVAAVYGDLSADDLREKLSMDLAGLADRPRIPEEPPSPTTPPSP